MSHLYHVARPVYTRADGPDQKRTNQSALNHQAKANQAKRKKSIALTTTREDDGREHRRAMQEVGEKASGRGDEPRGRGTDGTCRWENPDASHTNLAAEDNHHRDRTPRQHTPAPGDNEGTTPVLEGSLEEKSV
ncbi:hypothetical protein GQ42DRAFT_81554 [Ramicandelaber brevisporus]|nr:hypothetical protein GQ42DRAFT_81554 [Ramicandelaber brevisporus]